MMQFGGRYGFGSVSVRIRCICETALRAEWNYDLVQNGTIYPIYVYHVRLIHSFKGVEAGHNYQAIVAELELIL